MALRVEAIWANELEIPHTSKLNSETILSPSQMQTLATMLAIFGAAVATVWPGNIAIKGKCNETQLCNVTVPTFSTRCQGVQFDTDAWVQPDDISCVWYPNGSVWRGMNRTRFSVDKQAETQYIKNEIRGGMNITRVESLPNSAQVLILEDVGLEELPVDSSIDARGLRLVAIKLLLRGNKLRRFISTLSDYTMELTLDRNQIVELDISNTYVRELSIRENRINDTTLERAIFPTSLVEIELSENEISSARISWPEDMQVIIIDNNLIKTIPNAVQWPTKLEYLSLQNNSITEFWSNLPEDLKYLCLEGNNITAFYANQSQYNILSQLQNQYPSNLNATRNESDFCDAVMSTNKSNASCSGHIRTELLFGAFPICILPDTIVPVSIATTMKASPWAWVIVGVVVVGVVCILSCGFVYYRCRIVCKESCPTEAPWFEEKDAFSSALTCHLHFDVRFEEQFQELRIPAEAIQRRRVLARGGFGIVYEAYWKQNERILPVAMKRLLPNYIDDPQTVDDFMHEIRVYSTLLHPKIVQFYGITWTNVANLAIVMEYMPNGDIWSLLVTTNYPPKNWFTPLHPNTSITKLSIALDVLEAIQYLHSFPVIHRDIKAKNVLLGDTMEAKLSDFGTSRGRLDDLTMTAEIGTAAWIAPEVLKGTRYSEQADIYSFGVLLSEMDLVEMPYADLMLDQHASVTMTRTRIAMLVTAGEIAPAFRFDSPVRQIAKTCLNHTPEERPTAKHLLSTFRHLDHIYQPIS